MNTLPPGAAGLAIALRVSGALAPIDKADLVHSRS
jgi:hypothetical protein